MNGPASLIVIGALFVASAPLFGRIWIYPRSHAAMYDHARRKTAPITKGLRVALLVIGVALIIAGIADMATH